MTFSEDDDEIQEEDQKLIKELSEASSRLGLYLHAAMVQRPRAGSLPFDGQILVADFHLGDRAFEAVVQDPEQHRVDTEFRGMKLDAETDEFNEIRRQYRERMDKERWGPDEEEEPT